jgi:hypothetical protein
MERFAIVGTASSWQQTPWTDPTIHVASLNDAYRLKGFVRADSWYDLHPLNKYFLVPEPADGQPHAPVFAHQIPVDQYVRPAGHVDWLATQPLPVWLHPEHGTQCPASTTWPSARAFPKAAIEAHFGRYFTSTPAWMLAHAVLLGAKEIHIYGIHLATEHEYLDQRPGFEFLIGCVLGPGKQTITVKDGLRRYETQDGLIVLPQDSPVLSAKFQYAFEPSPRKQLEPLRWEMHKAQVKRERTIHALKTAKWYWPWTLVDDPKPDGTVPKRRVHTSTLQHELWQYDALVADGQESLQRASGGL